MLFLYLDKFVSDPHDEQAVQQLEDDQQTWLELLDQPDEAGPVDSEPGGKDFAPVICGASYFLAAKTRDKDGVEAVHTLVLDVDSDTSEAGRVPNETELRAALAGIRHIVYASPSHTTANPRWRVLLPLLTPLPPKKHRSLVALLSDGLVPGFSGCINVEATGDPCRLGFVHVTKHPEDYVWWSGAGSKLDWSALDLEDEDWSAAPLGGLERSALWTDRDVALRAALKAHDVTGQGIGRGQGRTMCLWETALTLWWAWAAEDEDFVLEVLRHVNANFLEPEDEEELERKCREAHQRTIGERRRGQGNGAYGWRREPQVVVSYQTIQQHARRLKQRHNPEMALIGDALGRLAKGESLSDDPETWRGLVTKCSHELARAFPSESAERVAQFFRPSLAAMRAAGAAVPTDGEVQAYVATRLESVRRQRAEAAKRTDAKMRAEIEGATRGERATKYTSQEVEAWRQRVGLRDDNWVVVSQHARFCFCNGTWVGPYTKDEFEAQVHHDLAAASDFVQLRKFNENKQQWEKMPAQKVLQEYGCTASTRVDFVCERAYFDVEKNELVLAGPKRREIGAKFHEEVDQWLRVLCGRETGENFSFRIDPDDGRSVCTGADWTSPTDKERLVEASGMARHGDEYDVVCDWLASVTQLDRPCAALYLHGVHSIGKGLFADGVGRIWNRAPLPLQVAFAKFNAPLLQTPLIWVDEGLPDSRNLSVLLRQALAAREHQYQRKYVDGGEVHGCLRMIFTANTLDLFHKANEALKREDVEALSLRFVYVRARQEAAWYLDTISPRHRDFVERNMIAEHALWLCERRWSSVRHRDKRFLVSAPNNAVSETVALSADTVSEVCTAICDALVKSATTANGVAKTPGWLVVKPGGEVFVAPRGMQDEMVRAIGASQIARSMSATSVSRAVAAVAAQSETIYHPTMKKSVRARRVDSAAISHWCALTGVYDWRDIEESIKKIDDLNRERARIENEREARR